MTKYPLPFGRSGWVTPPDLAIIHYSAGMTVDACVTALKNRKLSVHNSVERDGEVFLHRSWNDRCLHAGRGQWLGRGNINSRSYGVEVINVGWLDAPGIGVETDAARMYGPAKSEREQCSDYFYRIESYRKDGVVQEVRVVTKTECAQFVDHRDYLENKYWSVYPEKQVNAVNTVIWEWIKKSADMTGDQPSILIENVLGHEHVSPARKIDPGPAWPWDDTISYLLSKVRTTYPKILEESWKPREKLRSVQSHVTRLGIDIGSIDGIWGPATKSGIEKAISLFNEVYNLKLKVEDAVPNNSLKLCTAFLKIPGFNPRDEDHGGLSDDL